MNRIVVVTNNESKIREIKAIMSDTAKYIGVDDFQFMKDAGLNLEIKENSSTFEESAVKKALAVAKLCDVQNTKNTIVIADDSGLEIDYLNGEPGYLDCDTPQECKNKNIIDRLYGVPDNKRTARFVCVIVAVFPDNTVSIVRRMLEGRITQISTDTNGFAYDQIFVVPEYDSKTVAELDDETKNKISPHARALRTMTRIIEDWKATCSASESAVETLKQYAQFTVCTDSNGWHSMQLFDKDDDITNANIRPVAKIAPDKDINRLYQTAIKYCKKMVANVRKKTENLRGD